METIKEISERLGKSRYTIKSWASRAGELNPVIDEKLHTTSGVKVPAFTEDEVKEIEAMGGRQL